MRETNSHKIDGEIPVRFKYMEVPKDDFGLGVADILSMEDQELNRIVPMRRLAPYQRKKVLGKREGNQGRGYSRGYNEGGQDREYYHEENQEGDQTTPKKKKKKGQRRHRKEKAKKESRAEGEEPFGNSEPKKRKMESEPKGNEQKKTKVRE